jgi:O-antigen ligase
VSKKNRKKRTQQVLAGGSGRKLQAQSERAAANRGRRGRQSHTLASQWPLWTAGGVAAAIVAVCAAGFDDQLFAPFFVARLAPFYPLVVLFAALGVWATRVGRAPVAIDLNDVLGSAMVVWLALGSLLSPTPVVAWMGYYNRGSGALFWIALTVLFLIARRLLAGEKQTRVLVVAVAGTLVWAAFVAALQSGGVETWWRVGHGWPGRMTGTTGNPINLAGLCLLSAWLGVIAARSSETPLWLRVVAGCGVVAGLVGTGLAVTRASYLGLLAALVVVAIAWGRQRRLRLVGALGAVVAILVVAALVQVSSGGSGRTLLQRFQATNIGSALSKSDSKRVQLWNESLQAVADRPLLGYGGGAFVVADRLHRPPKRLVSSPWNVATDPHSAPLLLLATTGVVGGLLVAAIGVLSLAALLGRSPPRMRRNDDEASPSVGERRLAALAYLAACVVYLLVSPVDLVVVAPLALIVGAAIGPPAGEGRLVWRLPPAGGPTAARAVWVGLLGATGALFVLAVVGGALFWSADRAMAEFAAGDDPQAIRNAHERFPWEPLYALEAGARLWREGLGTHDTGLIEEGRALTQTGIDLDRTGPMGYADLARLAIAEGRLEDVPDLVRSGLARNPGHPVLQGLWAYSAFHAAVETKDQALSARLLESVEAYGPTTADAWHWIGMTYLARGDKRASDEALARARKLAPKISAKRYEKRLLRGR